MKPNLTPSIEFAVTPILRNCQIAMVTFTIKKLLGDNPADLK